ncbi:MAG: hypothetical protein KDA47_19200 [Planctomycetales bacterium]|nr:hypothetical protein [Planctomycetales bacterium]
MMRNSRFRTGWSGSPSSNLGSNDWRNCDWRSVGLALMVLAVASVAARDTRADEFRIDSAVYRGEENTPLLETKTLFSEGLAYDFMLTGSKEITVLDPIRGRIILLDPKNERLCTVSTEEILRFTAEVRNLIGDNRRETLDPEFTESYDEASKQLTMRSKYLIYESTGVTPKHLTAVAMYRAFADWSARLNAMRPNNPPPFGRLKLNAAIAERNLIPRTVTRTTMSAAGPLSAISRSRLVMRSDHLVVWSLSATDRKEIGQVSDYLTKFKPVTFEDYHAPSATVARN